MQRTLGLLAFLLPMALPAQVAIGDIAVTGFSSTAFGVISAGPTVTGYATPGYQGTGTGTSQSILWDRANPQSFLVGGFGFVGRATITGTGAVSYALITNNVGIVSQMSWFDGGLVALVDSGTNQVHLLDPGTAAVIDLSTGTQPWGSDASSGAVDPLTGDVVVGGSGAIYRLAVGSSLATLVVGGLGGYVTAIAFDPANGDIVATVLTANRLIRVDGSGAVADIAPPYSVPGPNALDIDGNGDFVTGGGTGQVYRVPHAGGSPVFLASNTSPANAVNGLAVVGGGGFGIPFGQACSGVAGPVSLTATGPYRVGTTVVMTSTNHAPNALGVLILGLSDTSHVGSALPYWLDPQLGTSGCYLHVSGDTLVPGISGGTGPASLTFPVVLQPIISGYRFYAQHVCLEAVLGGLSWSNGVAFRVP